MRGKHVREGEEGEEGVSGVSEPKSVKQPCGTAPARRNSRLSNEVLALMPQLGACTPVVEPWKELETPGWWLPQPAASLDDGAVSVRPSRPLAVALACRACGDLVKEATTCAECGHTFCYDCIMESIVIGGHHNVCPVEGCASVLGPQPFEHHKLHHDFTLDSVVSKVFPRPALDAALQARRQQREAGIREAAGA